MKNIIVCLIALLIFGCSTTPSPFYAKNPVFSMGTYQNGSNITEPRPAQSKYFRTNAGGFMLTEAVAGYTVYVDVIRKPERKYYTKAILQNPLDTSAPYIYEHYIEPETSDVTITHIPVKGLRIYQDYKMDLIVYEDEARTKEIDRLTQKIRCYVDTTTNQLFLYGRMKPKNL